MDRKSKKTSKVIELNKNDVKKMQREQFLEKRRTKNKEKKLLKEKYKFSKKDIIVIGIIILGIIIYYLMSNYHKYGLVFNKSISSNDAYVIETMNTDKQVFAYKDNILVFEKNILNSYNVKGKLVWQKKLEEIFTPKIYIAGDYIQITNKDTGYIYILDGQYEVGRIKLDGQILSSNINDEGTSIVEYSTSGLKTVLGVYNKKGQELYSMKLDNNTLSCYSISDNSRYLAYAYADILGISLVTKVTVLDLNEVNNSNVEFNDIISKNNEMIYKMFWENNTLHLMFNNSCAKYKASTDKVYDYQFSNINAINIDIDGGNIAYVGTDQNTAQYMLYVDKYNNKNIANVEIEDAPKHFIFENDLIYICSQKEINIYNKWGVKVKNYVSDTTITKPIIFDDGKCVAINISNKIIMFKI